MLFGRVLSVIDAYVNHDWPKSFADMMINMAVKIGYRFSQIWRVEKKAEKWAVALGWWIPRKYRGPIVGDILEDCHEMRDKSCGEWRIRIQVIWQWVIAVGTLIPAAFFGGIWRIFSQPK